MVRLNEKLAERDDKNGFKIVPVFNCGLKHVTFTPSSIVNFLKKTRPKNYSKKSKRFTARVEPMWDTIIQMNAVKKIHNGVFAYRISTNGTDYSIHYKKRLKNIYRLWLNVKKTKRQDYKKTR